LLITKFGIIVFQFNFEIESWCLIIFSCRDLSLFAKYEILYIGIVMPVSWHLCP